MKLVTTERRRNYLVSELNYHTAKFFIENLSAIEMKKTEILMNKPVYLELSILESSKLSKSLIVYIKTDGIYKDIAEGVETKFDTSNHELDRPLPKGKNKKVNVLMKEGLVGKIMTNLLDYG